MAAGAVTCDKGPWSWGRNTRLQVEHRGLRSDERVEAPHVVLLLAFEHCAVE